MHQVQVGTIEQHVELFRQQLTQAARTYFCGDNPETAPRIPTFPGRDEALALQSELEQLETDPTVATVICFGHKRELCEAYDEQLARRGVERAET
jgi:hypothetical protein